MQFIFDFTIYSFCLLGAKWQLYWKNFVVPGGLKRYFSFRVEAFWQERLEAEYDHVCDEINISLPREKTPDAQEDGLASTPLQAMRSGLTAGEKQEDADNLKNSTRASQAGLNSNAIHIPVTITAPPGETTLIPSECH